MSDPAAGIPTPPAAATTWEAAVQWLRAQPEHRELVREAYYDDPLDACARRYHASVEWQAVRPWLPAKGVALEIGAGRGIASYALAREGLEVIALEPDESTLVGAGAIRWLAQATGSRIDTVVGTSERLPLPTEHVDLVFARAVLHHTRDLDLACREVQRVLRPGGRFLAIREHVLSADADLPRFLEGHPLHRLYGGEHAWVLDRYVGAIEAAGMQVERILNPFQSAMNFAPRTPPELRREIAARLVPGRPLRAAVAAALGAAWPIVARALGRIDHRPGRLYSFVCRKPA